MAKIDVNVQDIIGAISLDIKVKGLTTAKIRLKFAYWLIALACKVGGFERVVIEEISCKGIAKVVKDMMD